MNQFEASTGLYVAAAIAVVLLVALVLLRTLTDGKAEVKLTDAVIALIPIVIALFATGMITKLVVGPEGVTVERATEAILGAATSNVTSQVDVIEPEPVEAGEKGGTGRIPEYLSRGVQALTFQVSRPYVGSVIEEYLRRLTTSPQFRYVVVMEGERFVGIVDARKLLAWAGDDFSRWEDFERWIREDPAALTQLPGFVDAEHALSTTANKQEALQRLEDTDRDWLPVVDDQDRFAGIVDRTRLTASLVLEVANRLESADANTQ